MELSMVLEAFNELYNKTKNSLWTFQIYLLEDYIPRRLMFSEDLHYGDLQKEIKEIFYIDRNKFERDYFLKI